MQESNLIYNTELVSKFQLKPFENEHSARINNPNKYVRFRRENNAFGNGIDVIWGILEDGTAEVQAIRFDANVFTASEAREWLREHDYDYISFEEATGEEKLMNITKNKNDKINAFYPVKSSGFVEQVKEVDLTKRTVKFIGNTYYWLDTDLDILIDGAAKRSINQKGPNSNAVAKIKHQKDHKLSIDFMLGKIDVLEESRMDGRSVIYAESKIPETPKGDEDLIKYQSGMIDNHSIGFRYVDIELAEKDSENTDAKAYWDEYYPQILNKEVADKYEFFWVVKEIELYEISAVAFGANSLTATLGVKGENKESVIFELMSRLTQLEKTLKTDYNKEIGKNAALEILQIKQIMSDINLFESSLKTTLQEEPEMDTQTDKESDKIIEFLTILNNK